MSDIRSYRDLAAWQQAMDLTVEVYKCTTDWPREELFGLTSQARRSSGSVAANIAEGYGRDNLGNYVQFLRMAQGSLKELETHMLVAERVGVTAPATTAPILERTEVVGKILRGLIRKLSESQ